MRSHSRFISRLTLTLALSLTTVSAAPRIWTSPEGGKTEAELVARSATHLILKRTSDGHQFTLPLTAFSEVDRQWVEANASLASLIGKPVDVEKLKQLQASIPKLTPLEPLDQASPACLQVYDRYARSIAHIKPDTIAQNVKNIRESLARDLQVFQSIAATELKNPPTLRDGAWRTGGGAWSQVWEARSNVEWLKGPLALHLTKIEALSN